VLSIKIKVNLKSGTTLTTDNFDIPAGLPILDYFKIGLEKNGDVTLFDEKTNTTVNSKWSEVHSIEFVLNE